MKKYIYKYIYNFFIDVKRKLEKKENRDNLECEYNGRTCGAHTCEDECVICMK